MTRELTEDDWIRPLVIVRQEAARRGIALTTEQEQLIALDAITGATAGIRDALTKLDGPQSIVRRIMRADIIEVQDPRYGEGYLPPETRYMLTYPKGNPAYAEASLHAQQLAHMFLTGGAQPMRVIQEFEEEAKG